MTDSDTTDEHREFDTETVPPAKQPEFVGVHSAVDDPRCRNWVERHPDGDCGRPATHTVVRYAKGRLFGIPMCDDCGHPERVADWNREWAADRERASGDTLIGDGGWDPEPADLRDGETRDDGSHARQLTEAQRALVEDDDGGGE